MSCRCLIWGQPCTCTLRFTYLWISLCTCPSPTPSTFSAIVDLYQNINMWNVFHDIKVTVYLNSMLPPSFCTHFPAMFFNISQNNISVCCKHNIIYILSSTYSNRDFVPIILAKNPKEKHFLKLSISSILLNARVKPLCLSYSIT
jgi:hypothetical protein